MYEPYDPEHSSLDYKTQVKEDPWWKPIADFVDPLVKEAARLDNPKIHSELEVRLGRFDERNRFRSGVSRHWFDAFVRRLSSEPERWDQPPRWIRLEEFVFSDSTRLRREHGGLASFIKKATVRNYDVPLKGSTYDLRFSIKTEAPAHLKDGVPVLVRLKERISFRFSNRLSFDFSRVWEGKCIQEALHARPKYEVEIECLDLGIEALSVATTLVSHSVDLLSMTRKQKRHHPPHGPTHKKPPPPPKKARFEHDNRSWYAKRQDELLPDQTLADQVQLLYSQLFTQNAWPAPYPPQNVSPNYGFLSSLNNRRFS